MAVQTKIKKEYIDAIEKDDFKHLPPMVYVQAYVKNLCSLYNIDGEEAEEILSDLRKDAKSTVPEEILVHLEEEKQVNLEEAQKVKRFVYSVMTGLALILLLVVLTVIYIFVYPGRSSGSSSQTQPEPVVAEPGAKFTETEMYKLIPKESLDMTTLAPRVNRKTEPQSLIKPLSVVFC